MRNQLNKIDLIEILKEVHSVEYNVGQFLKVDEVIYEIVGKIQFRNYSDNCTWFEYRLLERFGPGERWLSIDDKYREYSISWTTGELSLDGYHQVDKGIREVVSVSGDVDVVVGDSASFCEYEDKTEENIISVEQWDDIKEFSRGYYLDKNEICFANTSDVSNFSTNSSKSSASSRNGKKRINPFFVIGIAMLLVFAIGFIGNMIGGKSIAKFLKKSNQFTYVTSITGNDGEKADVYESSLSKEDTVMTIIEAVDGNVLDVEEDKTQGSESIAILTEDEYCMVYISVSNEVLVQISNRKYAYTSDKEPYHSSAHTHSYYRRYYYSAAYLGDARRYRRHHSPYENYNGERLDTDMFDQYDSYSDSIKRNSVNSRTSSGGGLSSGK